MLNLGFALVILLGISLAHALPTSKSNVKSRHENESAAELSLNSSRNLIAEEKKIGISGESEIDIETSDDLKTGERKKKSADCCFKLCYPSGKSSAISCDPKAFIPIGPNLYKLPENTRPNGFIQPNNFNSNNPNSNTYPENTLPNGPINPSDFTPNNPNSNKYPGSIPPNGFTNPNEIPSSNSNYVNKKPSQSDDRFSNNNSPQPWIPQKNCCCIDGTNSGYNYQQDPSNQPKSPPLMPLNPPPMQSYSAYSNLNGAPNNYEQPGRWVNMNSFTPQMNLSPGGIPNYYQPQMNYNNNQEQQYQYNPHPNGETYFNIGSNGAQYYDDYRSRFQRQPSNDSEYIQHEKQMLTEAIPSSDKSELHGMKREAQNLNLQTSSNENNDRSNRASRINVQIPEADERNV